jgi:ribosomal protein S18 acetylase RimI-like enzyme
MPELTYLQLLSESEFKPAEIAVENDVTLKVATPAEIRSLTLDVGRPFSWPSQRWTDDEWTGYLGRPDMRHWLGQYAGESIGIVSVNILNTPDVEIDSFGLLPHFTGRRLGSALLTRAVQAVWALPASRVWLHTSSDDHPNALRNYLARGFLVFDPAPPQ